VSGTTWTSIGPTASQKIQNGTGNDRADVNSGRMRTLLPDTGNANVVYALTAGGGLWKTTNFLNANPAWTALTDSLGSTAGGSASFGRVTTGAGTVLYVGVGDPFDANVGGFVIKSSDAGATWTAPIQLGTATRVLDLKVDISQPQDTVLVGTNAGLFRSTDGGVTYAAVADADVNGRKVWSLVRTNAGWLASVQDNVGTSRLVLSADRGLNWAPVAVDLPNPAALQTPGRTTLAVGVPGDATVYAFAAKTILDNPATPPPTNEADQDSTQYDLFYSINGGNNWTACNITAKVPTNSNADQGTMNLMDGQAFYNHLIVVDPDVANRDTVYLGGNLSTARSINAKAAAGGSSWTLLTNWLPRGTFAAMPYAHADHHCATIATIGGVKRLYFGNDGGIALSSDGGVTWDHSKNKGITTHLVYTIATGPICDPHTALIGLQDNGTHNRGSAVVPVQPTSGTVWDQTKGGDGMGVGWSQANNAATLASYVFNSIAQSTNNPPDDQAKWLSFVTGLGTTGNADGGSSYYFVTPIVTAPAGADPTGRVFYTYGNTGGGANSKKIFRSTAAGWASMGTLPNDAGGVKLGVRAVSHGVGPHPTDANRVAAACNGGYVITTTNGGTNWTARNLTALVPAVGLRQWRGFNANVAWVNNNVLFATSESSAANSIHVARSLDGGVSWAAAETGLPDLPVTKIVLDPGDATGNTLYAATWLGVYRTLDQGATWSLFGAGLPQVRVTDLYVHPNSAFIRAATWGRGVWQLGPTPTYTPATTHPYGGTFTVGSPINMSVTPQSTYPAPSYQWKRNGVNLANGGAEGIAGATTAALTIATPTCASAGVYTVTVSNCAGSVTSNGAVWTASVPATAITEHPANTTYINGANFALKVVATGAGLTYQWRKGGVNLTNTAPYSGVTTPTLSITGAANGTAGDFDCVVTLPGGCSATSNTAVVSKTNQAPNILRNPADLVRVAPASATFSVKVGGGASVNASLTFVWRKNGVNLTNAAPNTWNSPVAVNVNSNTAQAEATSTLTINPTAAGSAGLYDCVVTSSLTGSVTSAQARLTMQSYTPATGVAITPSPALPVTVGTPVTFTAAGSGALVAGTATPAPPAAYQYQFWVYWNDYLGWTMVQDYGVGSAYVLPGTTPTGTYGLGVNVRTNPNAAYEAFNAINSFTINPAGPGSGRGGGGGDAAGAAASPAAPPAPRISFAEFMQRRAQASSPQR
jgi:hypothetical protein